MDAIAPATGNGVASLFPPRYTPPTRSQMRLRAEKAPTRHYQPSGSGWWGWGAQSLDGKPLFTWFDVPRMMTDPKVRFISLLWRAPFQKVQFTVKASSPKVAAFVQNTIKRFWRGSLPKLLSRFFKYGFCAGGAEYSPFRGSLRLARVKAVECRDAQPRVWKAGHECEGQFAGFMLTNTGASVKEWVGSPHAFWFAGQGEWSPWYDFPPLGGMFDPWLEKNTRGGAIQARKTWFRKNAARGMEVRYPPGISNCGTEENPQMRDNQDIAREIADYHETNSTLVIENTINPATEEYEWMVDYAEGRGDIAGFLEYPDVLDKAMVEGAGIPLEVIQGSDSGSGYKGRLVSYGGHLGTVDELTGLILEGCEPWLTPLVHINYGPDAWYEIEPVSLAQIASEEEKRQPSKPGQPLASLPPGGGDGGGSPAGQFEAAPVSTNAPLPFNLSTTETVAETVRSGNAEILEGLKSIATMMVALVKRDQQPAPAKIKQKFGCAMIAVPGVLADQIRAIGKKIPDSALGEDGREDDPHITAKFGLHTNDANTLKPILSKTAPVKAKIGGVSVFCGADSDKPYDVLKFDVESDDLTRLNRELSALPHTDTHKSYCPHLTIAYVKAGLGNAIAAMIPPMNAEFTADHVTYSSPTKEKTEFMLTGSPPVEMAATATSDDDQKLKQDVFNNTQKRLMRTRKSTIAQLLALAMLRKQQAATAAGKPDAAAGSLQALSELAGDPMQVARIIGMKEMSSVEMSWVLGKKKKEGGKKKWVGVGDDAGKPPRYQDTEPGGRSRAEGVKSGATAHAANILRKIVAGKANMKDVADLKENLVHLPLATVNQMIKNVEFNIPQKDAKRWSARISKLEQHVEKMVAEQEAKNPKEEKPAEEPAAAPAPPPVPETVAGGMIGPDGAPVPLVAAKDEVPASGVATIGPEGAPVADKSAPVKVGGKDRVAARKAKQVTAPAGEEDKPQIDLEEWAAKVGELARGKGKEHRDYRTAIQAAARLGKTVKDTRDPDEILAAYSNAELEANRIPEDKRERFLNGLRAGLPDSIRKTIKENLKDKAIEEEPVASENPDIDTKERKDSDKAISEARMEVERLKNFKPTKANPTPPTQAEKDAAAARVKKLESEKPKIGKPLFSAAEVAAAMPKKKGVNPNQPTIPFDEPVAPAPTKKEETVKKGDINLEAVQKDALKAIQEHASEFSVGPSFDTLHAKLKKEHPELTDGQFHDILRNLSKSGHGKTSSWSKTISELPEGVSPMFDKAGVNYYAHPKSDGKGEPPEIAPARDLVPISNAAEKAVLAGKTSHDEIHATLKKQFPDLSYGQFEDVMSQLRKEGRVTGQEWNKTIHELPHPETSHIHGRRVISGAKPPTKKEAVAEGIVKDAVKRPEPVPVKIASLPDAEFAKKTQKLADEHPVGWGNDMVFIHHVYDALKAEDPSLTREQFNDKLRKSAQTGALRLEPLDMPQVAHPDDVRDAEVHRAGAAFHFIGAAGKDRSRIRGEDVSTSAPTPAPVETPNPAKRLAKAKTASHVDAAQKIADESDEVGKDYIESAIQNHRNGNPHDLASAMGRSIEESYLSHTGGHVQRTVPPEAQKAVHKALVAMGAKPEGAASGQETGYDSLLHENAPEGQAWFPGDKVRVVRQPLVLDGKVVARGKVEPAKATAPKPAEKTSGAKATATKLQDAIERTRTEPKSLTAESAKALMDDALAGHTDDEIRQIAKQVTGTGGRTASQARQYLLADLTAVWRMIESQKV